jgi:hypothetical protein
MTKVAKVAKIANFFSITLLATLLWLTATLATVRN